MVRALAWCPNPLFTWGAALCGLEAPAKTSQSSRTSGSHPKAQQHAYSDVDASKAAPLSNPFMLTRSPWDKLNLGSILAMPPQGCALSTRKPWYNDHTGLLNPFIERFSFLFPFRTNVKSTNRSIKIWSYANEPFFPTTDVLSSSSVSSTELAFQESTCQPPAIYSGRPIIALIQHHFSQPKFAKSSIFWSPLPQINDGVFEISESSMLVKEVCCWFGT
jgi:hypothetical protein